LALIGAVACQLLLFDGILPAYGQATDTSAELKRPAYQWLRFNEDWSAVLRGKDRSTTGDFWDRVKFIPLSPDGRVYFSLGGQARERVEYYNEFLFGDSTPKASDAYLLTRLRLSGDLHVTDYFRAFVEGRSAFATDRDLTGGATNAFESKFTLLNAFGDVKIPFSDKDSLTVRGDRYVGAETDLLVNYSFTRHLLGYAGYSHFFPGDFIRATGKHSQSDFLYAAFYYTF